MRSCQSLKQEVRPLPQHETGSMHVAGSERNKSSGATGKHFEEACNINK